MGFNCIYREGAQGQHSPSAICMIEVVKSYMPLNYRFMLTHSRLEDPLKGTVSAFNFCTKCLGIPGIMHDCTPNCHPVFWAWMRPHVPDFASFDSNATWVIDVFGLFFGMISMGVCTIRHCQTSGQLVQELNVCTVAPGSTIL